MPVGLRRIKQTGTGVVHLHDRSMLFPALRKLHEFWEFAVRLRYLYFLDHELV